MRRPPVMLVSVLLILSGSAPVFSTFGSYLTPAQVATSGPLVDKVILGVYTTESTMTSAVGTGSIQGPEWTFSTGAYTSLGSNPDIIEGTTVSYSWFGVAFNTLKFPGSDVHFRRALQFMQDYTYIQSTILNGVEGTASPNVLPCAAYGPFVCNPGAITSHYGTSQDLQSAGKELCQASDITGSQCPSGPFTSTGTWTCSVIILPACSSTSVGAFSPRLYARLTHHRNQWGSSMIGWASSIGLAIRYYAGYCKEACPSYPQLDVTSPGVYNSSTGYNSDPSFNATSVAANPLDMVTFGFIAGPAFNGNMQEYNSQFAGSYTNAGNIYDDPTFVTPADSIANYSVPTSHTTVNNLDYTSNKVFYAPDSSAAQTWAQSFATAYALQLPTVMGYFENTLFADNANGWTDFAEIPITGPNEGGGIYWTLMNVHQCGSSSCTIGAPNGGTLGGTFNFALQQVSDQWGLNPLYNTEWVWQNDVWQMAYDTPLVTPPDQFTTFNSFMDYLTTSHMISPFTGTTETGGSWYYFQQPCHFPTPTPQCQARAFVSPGPLQHGVGLGAPGRTIAGGQKITLTFRNDVYFSDGIKLTAKDFEFSLDILNVAASPNYPDNASPFSGTLGGIKGLLAAHIVSNYEIELYLGSSSFWNLGSLVVPVMPFHIWKYFNPDHVSTFNFGTLDTTQPAGQSNSYQTSGAPPFAPFVYYLNNLEVGAGPFWLRGWNTPSGTGEIDRNPFYFNSNWREIAATNPSSGGGYTFTTPLIVPIFNPTGSNIVCGPSSPSPITPNTSGLCQLMGSMPSVSWAATGAGKVKVYDSSGHLVRSLRLAKDKTTGLYFSSIPTGLARLGGSLCSSPSSSCYSLSPGNYKIVLTTTYTFHGQHRTWFQISGFSVP